MLGAASVFTVLTAFKFDITAALLGTNQLQSGIDRLSHSAMNAQKNIAGMGVSLLGNLGLMPMSILGAIGTAVRASEGFEQATLSWANLISANREHLVGPIDTFNDRLTISRKIMGDISRIADEFAIDQKSLNDFSKLFATELTGKGLAGENFGFAITMARNLIKSAPNLGVDPSMVLGQMSRMMEGGASMGDPFFRRLAMETNAMRPYGGRGGSERFNLLPVEDRVKTLNEALNQFSKDTDVLSGRFNSLTGQLNLLKNTVSGYFGILTPLGDVFRKLLIEVLREFNIQLDGPARATIKSISEMLSIIAPDAETALVNIRQASRINETLDTAKSTFHIIGIALAIKELGALALRYIPGFKGLLMAIGSTGIAGIGLLASGLAYALPRALSLIGMALPFISRLFMFLARAIFLPATALLFLLEVLNRARAYAEVIDAKRFLGLVQQVTLLSQRIFTATAQIFAPLGRVMDSWAQSIGWIFARSTWLDAALKPLEWLATGLESIAIMTTVAASAIEAMGAVLGFFVQSLLDRNWANMSIENFSKVWEEAFMVANKKFVDDFESGKITPQHQVNINKVTIENKFTENLEPDRIAFTMRDQLLKLSANAIQARSVPMYPVRGR